MHGVAIKLADLICITMLDPEISTRTKRNGSYQGILQAVTASEDAQVCSFIAQDTGTRRDGAQESEEPSKVVQSLSAVAELDQHFVFNTLFRVRGRGNSRDTPISTVGNRQDVLRGWTTPEGTLIKRGNL